MVYASMCLLLCSGVLCSGMHLGSPVARGSYKEHRMALRESAREESALPATLEAEAKVEVHDAGAKGRGAFAGEATS